MSSPNHRFRCHAVRKPISYTRAPGSNTSPILSCTSWGFYLEKRRERGVVAEHVGAQSLPKPRRPATQFQLRGPLGVIDRRHFCAALIMFYLEKRQEIRVVAEYVGEQSLPRQCRPATWRRLRGPSGVIDRQQFDVLCWPNASRFTEIFMSSPNHRF